jgi:hypothetical protein
LSIFKNIIGVNLNFCKHMEGRNFFANLTLKKENKRKQRKKEEE